MRYVSLDGGGSKLKGILFDDQINVLARGMADGVNTTQHTLSEVKSNLLSCILQLSGGEKLAVDAVYATMVGRREWMLEALETMPMLSFRQLVMFEEPRSALLAGAIQSTGVVVIAGTGSNAHCVGNSVIRSVGGWGSYVGDQGSGYWIGKKGLEAAAFAWDGVDRPTMLTELLMEEWHLQSNWGVVRLISADKSPCARIASVAKLVGMAAGRGDEVAKDILCQAGKLLAMQTNVILREMINSGTSAMLRSPIVLCGGAWKTDPCMLRSFQAHLHGVQRPWKIQLPLFEHVAAGPVQLLMNRDVKRATIECMMKEKLSNERINWPQNMKARGEEKRL